MISFARLFVMPVFLFSLAAPAAWAVSSGAPPDDVAQGKAFFQQNCALCHAASLGPGNAEIAEQGPSLVGVFGRRAAAVSNFTYSKALSESGLTWDAPTLDRFLANPSAVVPGTTMPVSVADADQRQNLIAYLATLQFPPGVSSATVNTSAPPTPAPATANSSDWRNAAPGVAHHLTLADLPAPYATKSVGNAPKVVPKTDAAVLAVPPGFTVQPFAQGLSNPRLIHVAPNGDIFIAETSANRIHVLRAANGAETPSENQIFADSLSRPFGIAFYPPGNDPKWIYVANINSIVRFPYVNGDLKARGTPQVIVPNLTQTPGGHTTRDIVFSPDGKRLFISIGSASNVATEMEKKSVPDAQAWGAVHGLGASWGVQTNRADVLVCDPEGREPLRPFATGIRNGVSLAINPETGDLWTATNERDGLGDDLVPDYVTRVKEGAFYGWPWYYLGDHEDPRHAGERPDLAGKVTVPDVLLQSHSAPLGMAFYTATGGPAAFPAEYDGDAFVACHGSWNRTIRTGYKIVRVRLNHGIPTGEYDDFLTGFVVDDKSVWGRPVGVAVAHDGALLMSDDGSGTVWRIAYSSAVK